MTEWAAQEQVPPVTFSNIPASRGELHDALNVLLQSLDYAQIHQEAQYWEHQAGLDTLADTSNITIADHLRDELMSLFDFDINAVMSSKAPASRVGHAKVRTSMTILALWRIAVTFDANIQPTKYLPSNFSGETAHPAPNPSTQAITSRDDLPTAASLSKAEKGKRRVMPKTAPPDDEPLAQASAPRDDLFHAASLPKAEKGKHRVMPGDVETFLSEVYAESIASSMASM